MKSNNPFEVHGIEHLSASKINLWVTDPALFFYRLIKGDTKVGPSAWRGSAVEIALALSIQDNHMTYNKACDAMYNEFEKERINNGFEEDEKVIKERDKLKRYYDQAIDLYIPFGKFVEYQEKVNIQFDDIEIPFIGYIDFRYKNIIRDTKTSTITPNAITRSHARQLALYNKAFPECECWVDYITPNKSTSYKLTDINQKFVEIQDIVFGLRKFLSISNDTKELASMLYPNLDSWMWNDEMINEAKRIWRI
jgi:hypothetical protein